MTPCKICGSEAIILGLELCYCCLTKDPKSSQAIDRKYTLKYLYYRLRHELNAYHYVIGFNTQALITPSIHNTQAELIAAEKILIDATAKIEGLLTYQWFYYRTCKEIGEEVDEPDTTIARFQELKLEIEAAIGRKIF